MKIGFTAPMHWSDEFRPRGDEFIKKMTNSINDYVKYNFVNYIIDNGSQYSSNINQYKNVHYTKIQDQSIGGITHAYNVGIYTAYKDNCDIIVVTSDDVFMNDSINKFIEYISNDSENLDCIYGPLTKGSLGGPQLSSEAKSGVITVPLINGFTFAFTRSHYEKYRSTNSTYFNELEIGKWAGQESQFEKNVLKGCKCKILNFCWLEHDKQRGWKKCLKVFGHTHEYK